MFSRLRNITLPVALLLLLLIGLPFSVIRGGADALAGDGNAATITPRLVWAAKGIAAAVLLLGMGLGLAAARGPAPVRAFLHDRASLWRPSRLAALARRRVSRLVAGFRRMSRLERAVFFGVLGAGIAARVVNYLRRPLFNDEAHTLTRYVLQPLSSSLRNYGAPNNHLLNTLLARFEYLIGGDSLAVLRFHALAAGCLVMVLTYVLFRRRLGRYPALLAMAFVAGAGPLVDYSTRVRGYSLATAFALATFIGAESLIRSRGRRGVVTVGVACALGLFSVPSAAYAVAGVFAWLMLATWRTGRWRSLPAIVEAGLLCGVLTLLCYGPLLLFAGIGPLVGNRWVAPLPFAELPSGMLTGVMQMIAVWRVSTPWPLTGLVLIGAIAALVTTRRRRQATPEWLPVVLAVIFVMTLMSRSVGFPRTLNFLLPLLCGWSAAGWKVLLHRVPFRDKAHALVPRYALVALIAMIGPAVHLAYGCDSQQDLAVSRGEDAARFIAQETLPHEPILCSTPYEATLWFYGLRYGLDIGRIAPFEFESDSAIILWDERLHTSSGVIASYEALCGGPLLPDGKEPRIEPLRQFGSTHIARVHLR